MLHSTAWTSCIWSKVQSHPAKWCVNIWQLWRFVVIAYLMKILHANFGHCCVMFEFMATDYIDFGVSSKTAFSKWCFWDYRPQIPSVQLKSMVFICPKQYYKQKTYPDKWENFARNLMFVRDYLCGENIFIEGNAFENVVCQMMAILS